jgi:ATP-dependent DNA ligase
LRRLPWVEPKLVAEIPYLTWTVDGLLGHTVYVGLREDKPAKDVRRKLREFGRAVLRNHRSFPCRSRSLRRRPQWLPEIKLDGFRMAARISKMAARDATA